MVSIQATMNDFANVKASLHKKYKEQMVKLSRKLNEANLKILDLSINKKDFIDMRD